jgi:predicted Fe-Mo cluster-binding NifX family protein
LEQEYNYICGEIVKAKSSGKNMIILDKTTSKTAIDALREAGCKVYPIEEESYMTNSICLARYEIKF